MPFDVASRVLENRSLGAGYFLTTFDAPRIAAACRPGQFVMAGATDPSDLLLRRPFSICSRGRGASGQIETISLLYRAAGRGTRYLAALAAGDEAALLGPLGNGFEMPSDREKPLLVAGGIGIAAFPFFVEELIARSTPPTLLYGGRTSEDLPLLDWFRARLEAIDVTTDDGSVGVRGFVTTPLEQRLSRGTHPLHLYTCGPTPMMRKVAEIASRRRVRCDAALETPMACGYGVCVGCVVAVTRHDSEYGRYRRVCVDGPVFDAAEVRW